MIYLLRSGTIWCLQTVTHTGWWRARARGHRSVRRGHAPDRMAAEGPGVSSGCYRFLRRTKYKCFLKSSMKMPFKETWPAEGNQLVPIKLALFGKPLWMLWWKSGDASVFHGCPVTSDGCSSQFLLSPTAGAPQSPVFSLLLQKPAIYTVLWR